MPARPRLATWARQGIRSGYSGFSMRIVPAVLSWGAKAFCWRRVYRYCALNLFAIMERRQSPRFGTEPERMPDLRQRCPRSVRAPSATPSTRAPLAPAGASRQVRVFLPGGHRFLARRGVLAVADGTVAPRRRSRASRSKPAGYIQVNDCQMSYMTKSGLDVRFQVHGRALMRSIFHK